MRYDYVISSFAFGGDSKESNQKKVQKLIIIKPKVPEKSSGVSVQ